MGGSRECNDLFQTQTLINRSTITLGENASAFAKTLTNAGTILISGPNSVLAIGTGTPPLHPAEFQEFDNGVLNEIIGRNSFGKIQTDGAVDLSGTLDVFVDSGYIPSPGITFQILTFAPGELSGEFSQVLFADGGLFSITYDNADGDVFLTSLASTPAPEPASWAMSGVALFAGLCLAACRNKTSKD